MAWAPCFYLGQYPSSPAWWWEHIVENALRPFLHALRTHPHSRSTMALHASSTEQLYIHGYQAVLEELVDAHMRGQLEFAETTYIPLVLPLAPWDEAARQLKKNHKVNAHYLGASYAPTGFFLPYGAYSRTTAEFIASLGYRWILQDSASLPPMLQGKSILLKGIPHLRVLSRDRAASFAVFEYGAASRPGADLKELLGRSPWCITSLDLALLGCYSPRHASTLASLFAIRSLAISTISNLPVQDALQEEPLPSCALSREADLKAHIPFRVFNDPENHMHALVGMFVSRVQEVWNRASREAQVSADIREKYERVMLHDSAVWASHHPWWSLTMVNKCLQPLLEMMRALPGVSETLRNELQALYERILVAAQGVSMTKLPVHAPARASKSEASWEHLMQGAAEAWSSQERYSAAQLWCIAREYMGACTSESDRMAVLDELCVAFRALPHLPLCG